jgi:hypothetical protein
MFGHPSQNYASGVMVVLRMAKEPFSIKILIKDAFSGVGPLGWLIALLKPANKGIEMLGEVDLFKTYGGSLGQFFDTGLGTAASIIIGAVIIGYAIFKRAHGIPAIDEAKSHSDDRKIKWPQIAWAGIIVGAAILATSA